MGAEPDDGKLKVTGSRPAVERVAALPRSYRLTDAEWRVLIVMACDSFDGETSMPGLDNLARWTGLLHNTVAAAVSRLCAPTEHRPALLERIYQSKGRYRTEYGLLLPRAATDVASDSHSDSHAIRIPDGLASPSGESPEASTVHEQFTNPPVKQGGSTVHEQFANPPVEQGLPTYPTYPEKNYLDLPASSHQGDGQVSSEVASATVRPDDDDCQRRTGTDPVATVWD